MKKDHLKYLLSLLLFGSNGIVASFIPLHSYEIVFFRTLIGSLFLLAVFAARREKPGGTNKKLLRFIVLSGIAMGASWMFLYEAYAQIGVGVATLAYYCGPVLVMALAPLVLKETASGAGWLALLPVVAGMLLVNGQSLGSGGLSVGLLCGLASAVLYAAMVILNKKAVGISGLRGPLVQLASAFATVAVFTLFRQGLSFSLPSQSILPLLLLGVVNTGVGCYLYFSSIPRLPARTVAIFGYLEPVSALLFSAAALGERLAPLQPLGTALILGGAAFGEFFHRKGTR